MTSISYLDKIVSAKYISSADLKDAVFELLSLKNFSEEEKIFLTENLLKKEERFSTYFTDETIVQSSLIKSDEIFLLSGVSKTPVKNNSAAQNDFKVMFLILYGEKKKNEYLKLLAFLYRMLSGRQIKNRLLSCDKEAEIKEQIIKAINEIEG